MSVDPDIVDARISLKPGHEARLGDVSAAELVDLATVPEQPDETREALRSLAATLIGGYTNVEGPERSSRSGEQAPMSANRMQ
jgi:hypothetical protein